MAHHSRRPRCERGEFRQDDASCCGFVFILFFSFLFFFCKITSQQSGFGPVLVATNVDGYLFRLQLSTGQIFWSGPATYCVAVSPLPDGSGNVSLITFNQQTLAAFHGTSGAMLWEFPDLAQSMSLCVANNSIFYCGVVTGGVHQLSAFSVESGLRIWVANEGASGVLLFGDRLSFFDFSDGDPNYQPGYLYTSFFTDLNGVFDAGWPFASTFRNPVEPRSGHLTWAPGSQFFFMIEIEDTRDSLEIYLRAFDVSTGRSVWNASDSVNALLATTTLSMRPAGNNCNVLVMTSNGTLLELAGADGTVVHSFADVPFVVTQVLSDQQGNLLLQGLDFASGNATLALVSTKNTLAWTLILPFSQISPVIAVPDVVGGKTPAWLVTVPDSNSVTWQMWLYA
jgi:outer membrane protein assembly factor BamB